MWFVLLRAPSQGDGSAMDPMEVSLLAGETELEAPIGASPVPSPEKKKL